MIYTMSINLGSMNLGSIWNKNTNTIKIPGKISLIPSKNIGGVIRNPINQSVNRSSIRSRGYWGTPTWYLFHTLAAKINSNFYNANYVYIWNFIKNVCNNLPCPFCKHHAMNYVKKIHLHQVSTKEKLKTVLYNFHNVANGNSGSGHQSIQVLNKYNKANITRIFELFENNFFVSYIGRRDFSDWTKNKLKTEYYEFYKVIRKHMN